MNNAAKHGSILTCSISKQMKRQIKDSEIGILKHLGLKNLHTYNIINVKEVIQEDLEIEYLLEIRNPSNHAFFRDDEIWKGDWGPESDKWTYKTR